MILPSVYLGFTWFKCFSQILQPSLKGQLKLSALYGSTSRKHRILVDYIENKMRVFLQCNEDISLGFFCEICFLIPQISFVS